jgi:broad specificity phosphatase PhoE
MTAPVTFWWVRHGPTHAKTMIGWTDAPADLSDTARLARLSDHLPAQAPVISSDLSRAVATADALAGPRLRLPHDPALREIHFGDWENRSFTDIQTADPERLLAFWDAPGPIAPPGGESWDALAARVGTAADALRAAGHTDLIVVAHFGAILTQLQRALGVTAKEVLAHHIDNLSVTRLRHDGRWRAETINHKP